MPSTVVPQTSLMCKFPGLSHLPPPHLEWLPLSLVYVCPLCIGLVFKAGRQAGDPLLQCLHLDRPRQEFDGSQGEQLQSIPCRRLTPG